MGKSKAHKLAIVLILILVIQACSPETPVSTPTVLPTISPATTMPYSTPKPKNISDEEKVEYFALIDPLLDEWEALIPLMSDRGSGWLKRIVELEEIRKEFSELEIDPYFDDIHTRMILHMDCQIAAYIALINSRDYSSGILLEEAEILFERCSFPTAK